jgi:hypothetical protein
MRSIVTLIGTTVSPASPFSKLAATTGAGSACRWGDRSPHRIRAWMSACRPISRRPAGGAADNRLSGSCAVTTGLLRESPRSDLADLGSKRCLARTVRWRLAPEPAPVYRHNPSGPPKGRRCSGSAHCLSPVRLGRERPTVGGQNATLTPCRHRTRPGRSVERGSGAAHPTLLSFDQPSALACVMDG